jgi:hypothetical protein
MSPSNKCYIAIAHCWSHCLEVVSLRNKIWIPTYSQPVTISLLSCWFYSNVKVFLRSSRVKIYHRESLNPFFFKNKLPTLMLSLYIYHENYRGSCWKMHISSRQFISSIKILFVVLYLFQIPNWKNQFISQSKLVNKRSFSIADSYMQVDLRLLPQMVISLHCRS